MDEVAYKILKSVNGHTKYLIYCYIHEIEKQYKLSANIPASIFDICILFFFIQEYFEKCGKNSIISGNYTLTKISTDSWENAAFGKKWFESNTNDTIKWTIKVIATGKEGACGINIGIISKEFDTNHSFYTVGDQQETHQPFYFNSNGYLVYDNGKYKGFIMPMYGYNKSNDTLTMELNLKKAQLIYYINDKCYGVAVDNIVKNDNVKYKFVVSLYFANAKIKLINFEHIGVD